MRILFNDYITSDTRGVLRFSPAEDPRISVAAKLGIPETIPLTMRSTERDATPRNGPAGSMTLRYQTDPDIPWSFIDIKAKVGEAGSAATLRGCYFDPKASTAIFGILPLVAATEGRDDGSLSGTPGGAVGSVANLRLGVRYTSPFLSSGFILSPAMGVLHTAWLVRTRIIREENNKIIHFFVLLIPKSMK